MGEQETPLQKTKNRTKARKEKKRGKTKMKSGHCHHPYAENIIKKTVYEGTMIIKIVLEYMCNMQGKS